MNAICIQEDGYSRTLDLHFPRSGLIVQARLTEAEAREIVQALAYGFGNLVTSDHVWGPIAEAAS